LITEDAPGKYPPLVSSHDTPFRRDAWRRFEHFKY
jgi:hypothetical protein